MAEVVEAKFTGRMERGQDGLRIRGPADPFVAAMREAKSERDRLFLATRALRKDPDCIEANLVVAAHCGDLELRILRLNIAVEAGETHWAAPGVRCILGGDISSAPGARPWMQALNDLGAAFETAGDIEGAQHAYRRLLEVDPSDRLEAQASLDRLISAPAPGR